MRGAFAWATLAAGVVACGMSLGSLFQGRPSVPMITLGILGAGVTLAGGRTVARERARAARERRLADERRRERAGRLRGALAVALLFVAAVAGACIAMLFL